MKNWKSAIAVFAASILVPAAIFAQQNPQFGNGGNSQKRPAGNGNFGGMKPGSGFGNATPSTIGAATYEISGKKSKSEEKLSLAAEKANETALRVKDGAKLAVSNVEISKHGNATNEEESNFYSLNAAVSAWANSTLEINKGKISTAASGANAVVAYGANAKVVVKNLEISTTKNSSRGLHATYGGTILGEDIKISTRGAHCANLATDRGEGIVFANRVVGEAYGEGSPGIYSTGDIRAEDSKFTAFGSEGAVIEGKNSIRLKNCELVGNKLCGAMLYQSFSGDAGVGTSVFDMEGGSLTANVGPVFFITNTKAKINLKKAKLASKEGVLVSAGVARWGRSGQNGGHLTLFAEEQELSGDVKVNDISSISIELQKGSKLTGTINAQASAGKVNLKLGAGTTWEVAGESSVDELSGGENARAIISRIKSKGNVVHYRTKSGAFKDGKTYDLDNGGKLVYTPAPAAKIESAGTTNSREFRGNGAPGGNRNFGGENRGNGGNGGPGGPGGNRDFGDENGAPPPPPNS